MNNQDIFNLIETNHKNSVELMNSMKTAINAETKASADMLKLQMEQIKKRQDIANGRVAKLEKQTAFVRWISSNPALAIPLMLILAFGIVFIVDTFGSEILFKIL